MDVHAPTRPDGNAVWQVDLPGLIGVGVWTEKKTGLGEDAEPLLAHHRLAGSGVVAVLDGAGGAGSAVLGHAADGVPRTSAWVAPRLVRALVEEWATSGDPATSASLSAHIAAGLNSVRSRARKQVKGSMRRELPTTLAAIRYRVLDAGVLCTVLWAGDSRCYLLDAQDGLQQLSKDHADSSDALALLTEDPPMTNMICADRPFEISAAELESALPCVLLSATDGFFGYVRTPAEFEHILLRSLVKSRTPGEWGAVLAGEVAAYTGDDASLVVLALGYAGWDELRRSFEARERHLSEQHMAAFAGIADDDRDALVRAREDSWLRYRTGYERLMPGKEEPGEAER